MKDIEERWKKAQSYEKNWWGTRKGELNFEFYNDYAERLLKFTGEHIIINENTFILEIGSGAAGILTHLKASKNRYAIDPLEDYYSTIEEFKKIRDSSVIYIKGKGENIPFDNSCVDFSIMDNVLDHCEDPLKVIREIKRVLKNDGLIYFKQNTYHVWGRFIRYLMEIFIIDKGHPHTFSKSKLRKILCDNGFKIIKVERQGYLNTWKMELQSKSLKGFIKAFLFVTRDKVIYLLSK
jgi:ubiquinone/menaquinone biosynthesis C-methylase UbiE